MNDFYFAIFAISFLGGVVYFWYKCQMFAVSKLALLVGLLITPVGAIIGIYWLIKDFFLFRKSNKNKEVNKDKNEREKRLDELKQKYNQHHKNTAKQFVRVKTRTIKYNLGNNGKTVGILIKNRQTRKKIKDEHDMLKKKTLTDVKDYLREKNLIKAGTMAPTDVLRTLYEQTILTGDVTNKSKDNLLHNFVTT